MCTDQCICFQNVSWFVFVFRLWYRENCQMFLTICVWRKPPKKSATFHRVWAITRKRPKCGPALWHLCCLWVPSQACEKDHAIPCSSLFAKWHVCFGILGIILNQARSCPRKNGHACHSVPCPHQHLQQCEVKIESCTVPQF